MNDIDLSLMRDKAISKIKSVIDVTPKIAVICGSGLGGLAELAEENSKSISFGELGLPAPSIEGHAGNFVFGKVANTDIMIVQGRLHPYEGHPVRLCTLWVEIAQQLGVTILALTNTVGSLNTDYAVGDLVVLRDHIALPILCGVLTFEQMGCSKEENTKTEMKRGQKSCCPYDSGLLCIAKQTLDGIKCQNTVGDRDADNGETHQWRWHEGVYGMTVGTHFDTPHELKLLKMAGCDVSGMSSAYEAKAGHFFGLKVIGLSVVTGLGQLQIKSNPSEKKSNHGDFLKLANSRCQLLALFFTQFIKEIF